MWSVILRFYLPAMLQHHQHNPPFTRWKYQDHVTPATSRRMRVSGEIAWRIPTSSGCGSKAAPPATVQDPARTTPPELSKVTTCTWRPAGPGLRGMWLSYRASGCLLPMWVGGDRLSLSWRYINLSIFSLDPIYISISDLLMISNSTIIHR